MNTVEILCLACLVFTVGYYTGAWVGISAERVRAVLADAGRYEVDEETGRLGFRYGLPEEQP
jgi:hypothetical protein